MAYPVNDEFTFTDNDVNNETYHTVLMEAKLTNATNVLVPTIFVYSSGKRQLNLKPSGGMPSGIMITFWAILLPREQ